MKKRDFLVCVAHCVNLLFSYGILHALCILIFVGKSYNIINPKGIKMVKQVFKTTFAGRELIVETGQVAKQANGSVVVRYGESTVLTAAVMSKKMATGDFFPLQVNYEEKM